MKKLALPLKNYKNNSKNRVARTQGSGWGAGVATYQNCPNCGRKTLVYGTRCTLQTGFNGFRCSFMKRGCSFDLLQEVDIYKLGLINQRQFSDEEKIFELEKRKLWRN